MNLRCCIKQNKINVFTVMNAMHSHASICHRPPPLPPLHSQTHTTDQDYMGRIKKLQEQVRTIVKPGCPQEVLNAALSVMGSVTEVLTAMTASSTNLSSL
ncbi:hypothetical protein RIF29_40878 [Crotalaria pallida]|uniref:Uncharacterized protein n=1 Tax=Crotalaria pallida TaxID=3830 RepID=A0AAN9E4N3_CROPI